MWFNGRGQGESGQPGKIKVEIASMSETAEAKEYTPAWASLMMRELRVFVLMFTGENEGSRMTCTANHAKEYILRRTITIKVKKN